MSRGQQMFYYFTPRMYTPPLHNLALIKSGFQVGCDDIRGVEKFVGPAACGIE